MLGDTGSRRQQVLRLTQNPEEVNNSPQRGQELYSQPNICNRKRPEFFKKLKLCKYAVSLVTGQNQYPEETEIDSFSQLDREQMNMQRPQLPERVINFLSPLLAQGQRRQLMDKSESGRTRFLLADDKVSISGQRQRRGGLSKAVSADFPLAV